MCPSDKKTVFQIEKSEEAEATFTGDDDCDVEDDIVYHESRWPKEDSSGFTFKGKKKLFVKAVESLKMLMKKGHTKSIDDVSFKVLDSRKMAHGTEYDVELNKDADRGVSMLKIFGPNSKQEYSILISKSRRQDVKFVNMLAVEVIKQLLNRFENGEGWKRFVKTSVK